MNPAKAAFLTLAIGALTAVVLMVGPELFIRWLERRGKDGTF